jgi:hypothetical protein
MNERACISLVFAMELGSRVPPGRKNPESLGFSARMKSQGEGEMGR